MDIGICITEFVEDGRLAGADAAVNADQNGSRSRHGCQGQGYI